MKRACFIIAVILVGGIISCNKIKDKSAEVSRETKRKVKDKSKDLVNDLFPLFDATVADTKYNKERFKEFLEIELTPDVKNIYAYGDFLGADYKVLIAFRCDSSTLKRIILTKKMAISTNESPGLHFPEEFTWWNKEITNKTKPYKIKDGQGEYLWYDAIKGNAYYEQFSL